jgi:hypothetical protein
MDDNAIQYLKELHALTKEGWAHDAARRNPIQQIEHRLRATLSASIANNPNELPDEIHMRITNEWYGGAFSALAKAAMHILEDNDDFDLVGSVIDHSEVFRTMWMRYGKDDMRKVLTITIAHLEHGTPLPDRLPAV